jgi:MFS family permease
VRELSERDVQAKNVGSSSFARCALWSANVKRAQLFRLAVPGGPFRNLVCAHLASTAGTWLAAIALSVQMLAETHSGTWVGLLLMANFAPTLALALFLGPLLDRRRRKRILIGSDLVNVLGFVLIALAQSPVELLVLALASGVASGFFRPSVYAGLPLLVKDAELPTANSLMSTVENVSLTLGPLLGGLLVAFVGTGLVYLLNAASFLISAYFISRIPGSDLQSESASSRGHWRDVGAGFVVLRRQALLFCVLCTWSVAAFGFSMTNVTTVVMTLKVFAAGSVGLGTLTSCAGVGLLLGGLSAPKLLETHGPRLYGLSLAVMSSALALSACSPSIWLVCVLFVLRGFANGTAFVCNSLIVQRGAPPQMRGRAIAILMGVVNTAALLGYLAGGQSADSLGGRESWLCAAGVLAGASLCGWALGPQCFPQEVEYSGAYEP